MHPCNPTLPLKLFPAGMKGLMCDEVLKRSDESVDVKSGVNAAAAARLHSADECDINMDALATSDRRWQLCPSTRPRCRSPKLIIQEKSVIANQNFHNCWHTFHVKTDIIERKKLLVIFFPKKKTTVCLFSFSKGAQRQHFPHEAPAVTTTVWPITPKC